MKVVFNGTIAKTTSGGCNCKGRVTNASFVRTKRYILPSGQNKTFFLGKPVEVNEEDGNFLLSYVYEDANGDLRAVFSKVEE